MHQRAAPGATRGTVSRWVCHCQTPPFLLGTYDERGTLRYAGRVGTGFTHAQLRALRATLGELERRESPFESVPARYRGAGVHWVEPTLVATKLHIPTLRVGMVPRDRLVAQLLAGAERRLTLVCAPAGWGKTVLLAQWHASAEERRPFAWVQLDPNDDDPVRLWRHVIGALRTVEPDIGDQALGALPVAGPALIDAVVAATERSRELGA